MSVTGQEHSGACSADEKAVIAGMLRRCGRLATLPTLAMKIVEITEDPRATWEDLREAVTVDPAFGARLLKLVNSPYYGMPRPIGTLRDAFALLGLRAVKNVAIATSLGKLFRGGRFSETWDASKLWVHSIAVAVAAQMLSRSTNVPPDEAFLAGLLHDVGIIVELQAEGQSFASMIERLVQDEALTFRCAERSTFQTTHEALGFAVCEAWKFPANLRLAVGFHHRPWELDAASQQLPALVHVADVLAAREGLGYSRSVETLDLFPTVLAAAAIEPQCVAAVQSTLAESVDQACQVMSACEGS